MRSLSELRVLLAYDRATGVFTWLKRSGSTRAVSVWNTRYAGKAAGTVQPNGYISIRVNRKHYLAHRLAWLFVTGSQPPEFLDHIDGVKANNSISNLRPATKSENMRNRGANKQNKSGYKGVSWATRVNKWQAHIGVSGKSIFLGFFDKAEDASAAYSAAALKLHGSFARIERTAHV